MDEQIIDLIFTARAACRKLVAGESRNIFSGGGGWRGGLTKKGLEEDGGGGRKIMRNF